MESRSDYVYQDTSADSDRFIMHIRVKQFAVSWMFLLLVIHVVVTGIRLYMGLSIINELHVRGLAISRNTSFQHIVWTTMLD